MQRSKLTSRRDLLLKTSQIVGWSAGGLWLHPFMSTAQAQSGQPDDPHFLLVLFVSGGLDATYLWDARPLSHSQNKLVTNYFKSPVEPTVWTGSNGEKTLVTPLMKPLEPFRKNFSIINGVLMADDFDGHEQNINFLFTGNAFGGDWFAPDFNTKSQYSLDGMMLMGNLFSDRPSNAQRTIAISTGGLKALANGAKSTAGKKAEDPVQAFAAARTKAISASSSSPRGRFSQGVLDMHRGIQGSSELKRRISQLELKDSEGLASSLEATMEVFAKGLSRTVGLSLDRLSDFDNFSFDVHGAEGAKSCPKNYGILIEKIAEVFRALSETPYAGTNQSFLDVTTVLVTSDFGRTTRQLSSPIDQSGTDHNPLSNTFLIGGKGFKGNMIVGASDLDLLQGQTYGRVSGAHKSLDRELIKMMGKPFDLKQGKVLNSLPAVFQRRDYLTTETIINTLLTSFGVTDKTRYRPYSGDRSGLAAPPLRQILT